MDNEPFEIILSGSNEEEAHYRLQNEPGEKQREYITGYDRKDALRVLGRLTDVVHGKVAEDSDIPCSLLIFEFAAERVRKIMGKIPFDDTVVFDPKIGPTTDRFPVERLGEIQLAGVCAVETRYEEDSVPE
ncbi:uncharacterized protein F4822DRAFT_420885 [Hypoxylon trugodes]|uniref:uncharacterized protein n=1 Tax=Hypoxylon trugodes TaxID=326681 RepID=UPI00219C4433|nr:uncharacterized protein F4822DRAFT_420885 [Hypoxylon trugodes]KAI1383515.1 hypothetical protein F4822DRAFT_420885 [Hypoxylon trugodes]